MPLSTDRPIRAHDSPGRHTIYHVVMPDQTVTFLTEEEADDFHDDQPGRIIVHSVINDAQFAVLRAWHIKW